MGRGTQKVGGGDDKYLGGLIRLVFHFSLEGSISPGAATPGKQPVCVLNSCCQVLECFGLKAQKRFD